MTIRRGEAWGEPGPLASDAPVFVEDRSARAHLQDTLDRGGPLPTEIGMVGGDLHRTLGAPRHAAEDLWAGRGMRFPVDLGVARLDGGEELIFLSHLIGVRRDLDRIFETHTVIAMNAAFAGASNLGPRAHPNDGRLDLTEGSVSRRERRAARRRATTGTHVPHPGLDERRVRDATIDLSPEGLEVYLDLSHIGHATHVELHCRPDALVVVV